MREWYVGVLSPQDMMSPSKLIKVANLEGANRRAILFRIRLSEAYFWALPSSKSHGDCTHTLDARLDHVVWRVCMLSYTSMGAFACECVCVCVCRRIRRALPLFRWYILGSWHLSVLITTEPLKVAANRVASLSGSIIDQPAHLQERWAGIVLCKHVSCASCDRRPAAASCRTNSSCVSSK